MMMMVALLAVLLTSCDPQKNKNENSFALPEVSDIAMYQVNPRVFAPEKSLNAVAARIERPGTRDGQRLVFRDIDAGIVLVEPLDEVRAARRKDDLRVAKAGESRPGVALAVLAACDVGAVQRHSYPVCDGDFVLAGEFARRMGLPVAKLVCASNANNVLTDFINTGVYDRRREFYKTSSPSMDILVSSNLERYLFMSTGGDDALVAELMSDLREKGVYTAPEKLMEVMRAHFSAGCADDQAALCAIGRVWDAFGYLMDTHTAVGWAVMEDFKAREDNGYVNIVLSTASPYKFCRDVLSAISDEKPETGFAAMDRLYAVTGIEIPERLKKLRDMPVRFEDCVDKDAMLDYVKDAVK